MATPFYRKPYFIGPEATPAIPATTVPLPNPFGVDCEVYITGGTVTAIAIDGVTTNMVPPATVRVSMTANITLTYSVAPTWVWVAD